MTPELKFILFAVFGVASLFAGYTLRKRKWLNEEASRPIHLYTLIFLWTPVSVWGFWTIEINATLFCLMAIQPIAMILGGLGAAFAAKLLKLGPRQAGVLVLAAALSNQGFTLGGYLCYALLTPADEALSYGMAFVTAMQVCMVILYYPVAAHFGDEKTDTVIQLMVSSFITIRAMPLYGAILGGFLSLIHFQKQIPAFFNESGLLNVFLFAGALGSYLGIGLRLRLGDSLGHTRLHVALVAVKFLLMPAATIAVAYLYIYLGAPLIDLPGETGDLPLQVVKIESFMPTAINAVILANLFRLDARLASNLWLINTTLFFCLPLPVIMLMF